MFRTMVLLYLNCSKNESFSKQLDFSLDPGSALNFAAVNLATDGRTAQRTQMDGIPNPSTSTRWRQKMTLWQVSKLEKEGKWEEG